jgi:hypothetical protein
MMFFIIQAKNFKTNPQKKSQNCSNNTQKIKTHKILKWKENKNWEFYKENYWVPEIFNTSKQFSNEEWNSSIHAEDTYCDFPRTNNNSKMNTTRTTTITTLMWNPVVKLNKLKRLHNNYLERRRRQQVWEATSRRRRRRLERSPNWDLGLQTINQFRPKWRHQFVVLIRFRHGDTAINWGQRRR